MLEHLRESVLEANLELQRRSLVLYTFGNASGIDRDRGLVVIKPSGVPYEELTAASLVVLDLDGRVVEGDLNPSSDAPTHLELYRGFPEIGGVAHTHSTWATAWAQAGLALPCYGTTHADYFRGAVPCTRPLADGEIGGDYETETGRVIVACFAGLDYREIPAVLVAGHGPFTWGRDALAAARHGVILEELAKTAAISRFLHPSGGDLGAALRDKHFFRKHGPGAYYGQGK